MLTGAIFTSSFQPSDWRAQKTYNHQGRQLHTVQLNGFYVHSVVFYNHIMSKWLWGRAQTNYKHPHKPDTWIKPDWVLSRQILLISTEACANEFQQTKFQISNFCIKISNFDINFWKLVRDFIAWMTPWW